MIERAVASLKDAALFGGVRGNPAASHVEAGLRAYRAGGHDGVVAFGGGAQDEFGDAGGDELADLVDDRRRVGAGRDHIMRSQANVAHRVGDRCGFGVGDYHG